MLVVICSYRFLWLKRNYSPKQIVAADVRMNTGVLLSPPAAGAGLEVSSPDIVGALGHGIAMKEGIYKLLLTSWL